jgi:hypothetical protein
MTAIPQPVTDLIEVLTTMPGTIAVVLGGSRAVRSDDEESDWDLGVYYRGEIDLTALSALGTVFPPGSWGRVMNGGAWLELGGEKVDVILRDLDVVEYWTKRAQEGEFDRDALLGYLAGIPTYTMTAELASCVSLHGNVEAVPFPPKLAEPRRRFGASVDRSVLTTRACMRDAATLPVLQGRRLRQLWKRRTLSCASAASGSATRNA